MGTRWLYVLDWRKHDQPDETLSRYGPFNTDSECFQKWNDVCGQLLEDYLDSFDAVINDIIDSGAFVGPEGNIHMIYSIDEGRHYELDGEIVVENGGDI